MEVLSVHMYLDYPSLGTTEHDYAIGHAQGLWKRESNQKLCEVAWRQEEVSLYAAMLLPPTWIIKSLESTLRLCSQAKGNIMKLSAVILQ